MTSKSNTASAMMWENHRKRKELQFRQRERQQRLQEAVVAKSDQDLIEEALAKGRITKCAPGATSGGGSDAEG